MHKNLLKVVRVSAADTPNIDSAGATSEFVFGLPFVVTRVGLIPTTAINPDNSTALTATLTRRVTIGSASGAVTLGTWAITTAAHADLPVGSVFYKDLHIDDTDGEAAEDGTTRNEAPSSNITVAVTAANPWMIPPSQSFCVTLDNNAEADSGACYSFVEGYYLEPSAATVLSTASVSRDTSNDISTNP